MIESIHVQTDSDSEPFWRERSMWPLSHSIVPMTFYALTGSFTATIIAIYVWESLEYLLSGALRRCCGNSALSEKSGDSLVADPLMGIFSALQLAVFDCASERQLITRLAGVSCLGPIIGVLTFIAIAASLMLLGFTWTSVETKTANLTVKLKILLIALTMTPTAITSLYAYTATACVLVLPNISEPDKLILGLPTAAAAQVIFVAGQTAVAVVTLVSSSITVRSSVFFSLLYIALLWLAIALVYLK